MGFHPNGGPLDIPVEERLNVFALVVYIPDPLARVLDDLRRELVPHYEPHAHVSILPPRPLAVGWDAASSQARAVTEAWPPFEMELTTLEVFPVTDVIYLEVGRGNAELRRMHEMLNTCDAMNFDEPFAYHPHVTLAQEIPHCDLPAMLETARRRWAEYPGSRTFRVETVVFVQNTLDNRWIDLAEYCLGAVAVK